MIFITRWVYAKFGGILQRGGNEMVDVGVTNQPSNYSDIANAREHAWQYFALHAEQRMRAFHFFLILSTILIAGSLTATREDLLPRYAGALGLYSLAFFSFVFWKLDQRSRTLIQTGEAALKAFEALLLAEEGSIESVAGVALFTQEDEAYQSVRSAQAWWRPWSLSLSFSQCFALVFLVVGIAGAALGTVLLFDVDS